MQVMGILNVTPDSFSDGGQFEVLDAAVSRGIRMRDEGATLIDVGGESTRPGATRVSPRDEQARVIPVVKELAAAGVVVSVDTMNASTAFAAAQAGASVINDVSGGLADPAMYRAVVETGLHYIAMHWRGSSDAEARYSDVVADVRDELKTRLSELIVSGVDPAKVILDPGLGFAKNPDHNWRLLAHLDELKSLGYPVLVGASRKRFLSPWGAEPADRDAATAIVSVLAARAGAWGVRVHDVAGTNAALEVVEAWRKAGAS